MKFKDLTLTDDGAFKFVVFMFYCLYLSCKFIDLEGKNIAVGKVFEHCRQFFNASGNRVKLTNLRPTFRFLPACFTYAARGTECFINRQ